MYLTTTLMMLQVLICRSCIDGWFVISFLPKSKYLAKFCIIQLLLFQPYPKPRREFEQEKGSLSRKPNRGGCSWW